ncbi:MAG TPA: 23S rRNA (guanosine(2251)-2'-O)-methyltransferase RlmB [Thermotogota bacterium]|nr:23S rRNA (guanosine(2251)-2'-O)-methyltransferase RlmB [Thermotogota bacterium]
MVGVYLYGKNALTELLKSQQNAILKKVFLSPSSSLSDREESLLKRMNVQVTVMPLKTIEQLVGKEASHQGVVLEIKDFQYQDYEELLEVIEPAPSASLVFLDQVQDPHNLGAIIRTAYSAGMDGLVICQDNSASVTPAVVKVSSGSAFLLPICIVNNLRRALERAKEKGFWIYGTEKDGRPYPQAIFPEKVGLVFGNEGSGMRRLVKESCDETIAIPMANPFDSLNVSVSAGILCFEILRRRLFPETGPR